MDKDRDRDRKKMLNSKDWSHWPLLPIKRTVGSNMTECALLIASRDKEPDMVLFAMGNLFSPNVDRVIKEGKFRKVDDVIADGWVVD